MLHEMKVMENYLIEEKEFRPKYITGGHHTHHDINEHIENDLFHKLGESMNIIDPSSNY